MAVGAPAEGNRIREQKVPTTDAASALTQKLLLLEAASDAGASKLSSAAQQAEISDAINVLRGNPEIARPLLLDAFSGRRRKVQFRATCAHILREIGVRLPPDRIAAFSQIVRDESENEALRIDAAHFLLGGMQPVTSNLRGDVLKLADESLKRRTNAAHVRLMIIQRMIGDSGAERLMMRELDRGIDLDPTLNLLGKMKSRQAVDSIIGLLNSKSRGMSFSKTRAVLALGEIGDKRAADELFAMLGRENRVLDRRILLLAIGLSKDARARNALLGHLRDANDSFYGAALQGLRYLGDRSTIPILQKELERGLPPDVDARVRKTIESIQNGGEAATW
jgi:HEAT repeat protein